MYRINIARKTCSPVISILGGGWRRRLISFVNNTNFRKHFRKLCKNVVLFCFHLNSQKNYQCSGLTFVNFFQRLYFCTRLTFPSPRPFFSYSAVSCPTSLDVPFRFPTSSVLFCRISLLCIAICPHLPLFS